MLCHVHGCIDETVIPADAGIQTRGTAWILACVGMTTTLQTPYVDILEYITRSSTTVVDHMVSWLHPHVMFWRVELWRSSRTHARRQPTSVLTLCGNGYWP